MGEKWDLQGSYYGLTWEVTHVKLDFKVKVNLLAFQFQLFQFLFSGVLFLLIYIIL